MPKKFQSIGVISDVIQSETELIFFRYNGRIQYRNDGEKLVMTNYLPMIKKHVIFTHIKRHSNISVGASGLLSVPFEDVLHAVTIVFVAPYCACYQDGVIIVTDFKAIDYFIVRE